MARNKKNISIEKSSETHEELNDFLKENLSGDLFSNIENEADDEFMKDAMEGLGEFSSTKKIHGTVNKLNKKLVTLTKSNKKTKPFEFKQIFLFVIAIIIIILLVLLGYEVINLRK